MKTAELVRQLREADPSGELECVVGSHNIHFVTTMPHKGYDHESN